MKTLLLMLIIGICAIAWRTPEIVQAIGIAGTAQDPAQISIKAIASASKKQKPMTADEFAALSKTDPNAYQKFINSYQAHDPDRSEIDKLMNFLSRGKFE